MNNKNMILGLLAIISTVCFVQAIPADGLILRLNDTSMETSFWETDIVVAEWLDQSGSANDFVQTTGDNAKMPLLISSGLNGYDTVKFNTDDQLRIAAADAGDFNPVNAGMTIVMVMKVDSLAGTRYLFRKGNFTSSADQGWSIWTDATRVIARLNSDNVNDDDHKAGRTQAISDKVGQWVVYSMVIGSNASDTSAFAPLDAYVDGTLAATNVWNNGEFTGTIAPPDSLYLNVGGDVEYAEILAYSRPLDSDEMNEVGSYLSKKYSITTSYPVIDDCQYIWLDGTGLIEDVNHDCVVNLEDFAYMATHWGEIYDPALQ